MPVPSSPKPCGLAGALSVTVTEPVRLPAAAGVKIRVTVQLELGAKLALAPALRGRTFSA